MWTERASGGGHIERRVMVVSAVGPLVAVMRGANIEGTGRRRRNTKNPCSVLRDRTSPVLAPNVGSHAR